MYLIEEDDLALAQYTHDDDHDMYLCWQDEQTQKGYNYVFDQPFERFKETDGLEINEQEMKRLNDIATKIK